jgi:hypothetical protein
VFRGHQHIFVPYNKACAAEISNITRQRRTEPMTRREGGSPHGRGKCSNFLRSNASQAGKQRRCIERT